MAACVGDCKGHPFHCMGHPTHCPCVENVAPDEVKDERARIIAALREPSNDLVKMVEVAYRGDGWDGSFRRVIRAVADWLENEDAKMTADTDRPWYALATYFDPKPYRRRPKN